MNYNKAQLLQEQTFEKATKLFSEYLQYMLKDLYF